MNLSIDTKSRLEDIIGHIAYELGENSESPLLTALFQNLKDDDLLQLLSEVHFYGSLLEKASVYSQTLREDLELLRLDGDRSAFMNEEEIQESVEELVFDISPYHKEFDDFVARQDGEEDPYEDAEYLDEEDLDEEDEIKNEAPALIPTLTRIL